MATVTAVSATSAQPELKPETAESAWGPLYRVAGAAALLSVATIVVAVIVFIASPPPSTITDWFTLFHKNGLLGLLDLDLLLVTTYVVMVPIYLALYVVLRRVSPSFMAIALAFNLVGVALILAVNPGAAMLTLSDQYATATTGAQQTAFLAAGQALIANWSGTAFDVGYLLGGVGVLITATVMLRSNIFSKLLAYTGFLMGALMIVPASAGTVGVMLSLVSLVPTVIWLILIARRLFRLAAPREKDASVRPAHVLEARTPQEVRMSHL